MMNNNIPQVKTVKLLLLAMEEQQQAMFKMAFKMHSTTNYQVLDASSGEKPELVIVDGDSPAGISAWLKAKGDYPNSTVVHFAKSPPSVTAPHLPKPIKFDTLFLNLRNLMQGNGIWVVQGGVAPVHAAAPKSHAPASSRASEVTIPRFDPNTGLLGIVRRTISANKDTLINWNGKPILALFPEAQKAWLAIDATQLHALCQQENPAIEVQAVGGNVIERANSSLQAVLWQVALWTANGRLAQPLTPNTIFQLKYWPNLTRLVPLAESMRLSAFLTRTAVSLNMLYKMMPLDMPDILNYISTTYLTDYLSVSGSMAEAQSKAPATIQSAPPRPRPAVASEDSESAAPRPAGGGLLSRLMKKLLNK